jgi:hypothetical protein
MVAKTKRRKCDKDAPARLWWPQQPGGKGIKTLPDKQDTPPAGNIEQGRMQHHGQRQQGSTNHGIRLGSAKRAMMCSLTAVSSPDGERLKLTPDIWSGLYYV